MLLTARTVTYSPCFRHNAPATPTIARSFSTPLAPLAPAAAEGGKPLLTPVLSTPRNPRDGLETPVPPPSAASSAGVFTPVVPVQPPAGGAFAGEGGVSLGGLAMVAAGSSGTLLLGSGWPSSSGGAYSGAVIGGGHIMTTPTPAACTTSADTPGGDRFGFTPTATPGSVGEPPSPPRAPFTGGSVRGVVGDPPPALAAATVLTPLRRDSLTLGSEGQWEPVPSSRGMQ